MDNNGFLYVATGDRYIQEAIASARTIKQHMPNGKVALVTDGQVNSDYFDYVIQAKDVKHYVTDKITNMLYTPFTKTIFLDTDTIVCRNVEELFLLLDRFEIAAAMDVRGGWYPSECSSFFPELNTGVIVYKNNPLVFEMLTLWNNIYAYQVNSDINPPHDQPSFRDAVYRSGVQFATLSYEYNLRTIFPMIISRCIKPAILHGRNVIHSDFLYFLGCVDEPRVIMPSLSTLWNGQIGFLGAKGKLFTKLLWKFIKKH